MSVYNDEEYLPAAIESILGQTYDDFEFIIIDDGSTDSSREIIDQYDDERLTLLENEENRGLTASLNRAIDVAEGQYVARQDADDRSHRARFERQIEYLGTHPKVALVGTGARLIGESGTPFERRVTLAKPSFEDLLRKNRFVHGSVMIRREVLAAAGGYDERFEQVQDYELWLRLAREHPLHNLPDPLYDLRLHAESVFFDQQEESVLYALLAKRMAQRQVPSETLGAIECEGIEFFENVLTDEEQQQYHLELARTYLRYDRPRVARSEARRALGIRMGTLGAMLPFALSFLGRTPRRFILKVIRTALNGSIRVRNQLGRNSAR